MIAIFRDDFRKYYTIVFPLKMNNGTNIGVTKHDDGKTTVGINWEPPSRIEVEDRIENKAEYKKLYREIVSKLDKDQQKELLVNIFIGEVRR